MVKTKLIRIIGLALVVSLMLVTIPATAVFAAKEIDMGADSGEIGEEITVEGADWPPSTSDSEKHVVAYFTSEEIDVGDYVSNLDTYERVFDKRTGFDDEDDSGDFYTEFTVPDELNDGTDDEDVESGDYYIGFSYYTASIEADYIWAVEEFTVTGGEVASDLITGKVDTEVNITGTGFSGSTVITVLFDSTSVSIHDGNTQTTSSGSFDSYIYIPDATAGSHNINITVGSTTKTIAFTVVPGVSLNPTAGKIGDTVLVTGTGFGRRNDISLYLQSQQITFVATTDTSGYFSAAFQVPETTLATGVVYQLEADDGTYSASASFTLNPATTPTQTTTTTNTTTTTTTTTTPVNTGSITVVMEKTQMVIAGVGFTPGATVAIQLDGTQISTTTADANGYVTVPQFEVPDMSGGEHVVTLTDGTNSGTYTYVIESDPPAIPQPVSPGSGAEVKGQVEFEWEPVSDISLPVTYQLQIATAQSFSSGSIVLDILDIEAGYYQLTELELAELEGVETPYYYRVRAIDGADNAGSWTPVVDFTFKTSGGFPNWAIYTLAGVGGVLLFGIGYLVGRRTAFYY